MKILKLKQPKEIMEIYVIGDTHYPRGKRGKFLKVLDEILKNKNGYLLGIGDWCENIVAGDPRYNPEDFGNYMQEYGSPMNMINQQWQTFEKDILPLAKANKIIGLHAGNHESTYSRRHSDNKLKELCERNNIVYLDEGHIIHQIEYKGSRILIQSFHGCGGGTSIGGNYNKLDSFSLIADDVDVILAGHTHKLGINITADRLKVNNGDVKQQIQYQCSCGSFLGNYDIDSVSYAERNAYRPLPIGYVKIVLNKGKIAEVKAIPV